jgi:Flp pilus assembly pilin Flp
MTTGSRSDRGAVLVEYALLIVLLAVVCIGAVILLTRTAQTQGRVSPVSTTSTVP